MKRWSTIILIILGLGAVFIWYLLFGRAAQDPELDLTQNAQPIYNAVVGAPVGESIINDRLVVIGTGRAFASVSLTPWTSGTIEEFFVRAGDRVKTGDRIAALDADNELIAVEKAKVERDDAQLAVDRIVQLRQSNTVSEVQELTARLALSTAELELKDAELALSRRTITAPFDGVVGILPVDIGNYVTVDTTIARIDDRSTILVDIWVPERFAPLIELDQPINASSIARPGEQFQGTIEAIDNMIEADSRTLRVRARLGNDDDRLRAGMSFNVELLFPGDYFPSVNPLAIQWDGEGAYVWRIEQDQVRRVWVAIIQRNTTSVLVKGDLAIGDLVAVQGVQNLRENATITLMNAEQLQSDDRAQ